MPWTGSIYRKGNYGTNGWTGDAANNIGIEAGRHDVQDNDFQDGINACLNKAGANTPTANLPMGGFKHTGGAAATTNGDYLLYDQVTDGNPLKIDFATKLVYVNATTSAGVTAQVHLRSTTATRPALLVHQGVADTAAAFQVSKQTNSNTQDYVYFIYNNGVSGNGKIVGNGADQAAFGSYSDQRLKENIQELSPQLANILALRPVEFDYKNGSGHQIGFIAQEVEPIYPDVVSTDVRTNMLTLAGLGKWDARLVKAIQELSNKIEALETKIENLEAVTAAL